MSQKLTGLTLQEVEESKQKHGRDNTLSQKEQKSFLSILIDAFKDIWILVLLGTLVIRILINLTNPAHADWLESIAVIAAILIATGGSARSEYSSEKEFSTLQASASKITINVLREGRLQELNIDHLVIGDIVKLRAGDKVPADGYILEGKISVNQQALNGESDPSKKKPLGDNPKPDMTDTYNEYSLFRGSDVLEGEAYMYVAEVGDKTMIGTINTSLQEDTKESPSKAKLNVLAGQIGKLGLSAAIGYFIITTLLFFIPIHAHGNGNIIDSLLRSFMYSVTIIIMAVPEGLPMMLSLVGGMMSQQLLRLNILVRHAESIETAGYMNILFSDKTGTITEGKMSVVDIALGNGDIYTRSQESNGSPFKSLSPKLLKEIKYASGLNNDAFISNDQGAGGNPTDNALMTFLHEENMTDFDRDTIVDKELFDSLKKFASVTIDTGVTYIKGAPEFTMSTIKYYLDENGDKQPFTDDIREAFTKASDEQANRSMRVLALIQRDLEGNEILIAGVCLRDNVRSGMRETLQQTHEAGVQVVMVTGDRKETALAISKDAGIYTSDDQIILTHDELEQLSDEEIKALLPKLRVVARALPMDKKRLVKLAQELDYVVGMTGDGVNDAAALKAADIGFSLGDGTQTAQGASDLVLLNNSLNSIVTAILYGRTMTKSVQKFITFQLTVNMTTIAMSLLSPIFAFDEPFTIIQILFINLIMDTLAALAFGLEPALSSYLKHKPIARSAKIVTSNMISAIAISSLFITTVSILILTNFANINSVLSLSGEDHVKSFMFSFFIYSILANSLNTRSEGFNLFEKISENKRFIYVMGGLVIAQTFIIQFGGKIFSTVSMDITHYLFAMGLALCIIPIDMIRKAIMKKIN